MVDSSAEEVPIVVLAEEVLEDCGLGKDLVVDPADLVPAEEEDVRDGDLLRNGPGVPLAYHVLIEFLAVENPVDVPAEVVLDPHFQV